MRLLAHRRPWDLLLARRAYKHGAKWALRIIAECRRLKLAPSLGFAMVEQESEFHNVFGHDDVRNPIKSPPNGLLTVTRGRYEVYLRHRRAGAGMQGVGPMQLTYYTIQDVADRRGGCWRPGVNIAVGLEVVASHIHQLGERAGIAAYNGSGAAADAYASEVLDRAASWHKVLR